MRFACGFVVVAVVLGGCGDDAPDRPPPLVRLDVVSPADGAVVDGDEVTLRGRVTPAGASVAVLGRPASSAAGAWEASVPLEPGGNVVDVMASAEGRRPVFAAVRVVRRVPVEIPDVDGDPPREAVRALEALGLDVVVRRGGGLLDDLLPATLGVCSVDPSAGTEVRVGSVVTLEVAKVC